jgi:uncharacterized protein (TIGR02594 family)
MFTIEPPWLTEARKHIGLREIPGKRHNPTIVNWGISLGAWWKDDETPWCGTFVAHCLRSAGQPVPAEWYRARAWGDYGSLLRPSRLAPGAILVFSRGGSGHVGFYLGEDPLYYHVLGGNQRNSVNAMLLEKPRCIATRWPRGVPVYGGPIQLSGGVVSTNEA